MENIPENFAKYLKLMTEQGRPAWQAFQEIVEEEEIYLEEAIEWLNQIDNSNEL